MVTPKQIIIAIGGLAALGLLMRTPAPISPLRAGNEIPTYNFAGGYLAPGWADGSLQVPPPPTPGSEGLKRDEAAREAALKLRDTPRYVEAVADSQRSSAATLQ